MSDSGRQDFLSRFEEVVNRARLLGRDGETMVRNLEPAFEAMYFMGKKDGMVEASKMAQEALQKARETLAQ